MQTIIFTALITACLCSAGFVAYGQTFSEWWQQKKTRIKYLHKQIAALEELRKLLREGYQEAEDGEDSIEMITGEELAVHKQFLDGLRLVKPALKDSAELMSSYALVAILVERVNETLDNYVQQTALTQEEIEWLSSYLRDLIREIRSDLRELEDLTTGNELEMKDAERRETIHMVEQDIRAGYENGMTFLEQMNELLIMSKQQKANVEFLKKLL